MFSQHVLNQLGRANLIQQNPGVYFFSCVYTWNWMFKFATMLNMFANVWVFLCTLCEYIVVSISNNSYQCTILWLMNTFLFQMMKVTQLNFMVDRTHGWSYTSISLEYFTHDFPSWWNNCRNNILLKCVWSFYCFLKIVSVICKLVWNFSSILYALILVVVSYRKFCGKIR